MLCICIIGTGSNMKAEERKRARVLRQDGWSVGAIAKQIGCSKGSVSHWVSDIPLTPDQLHLLESNQARGRALAANHPNGPREAWRRIREGIGAAARAEIVETCTLETLKVLGSALYWAEGYKRSRAVANFSNSDPAMIALMMDFFRRVCHVPEHKFRGVVHIHPHLDANRAMRFWAVVSGIPLAQFHKTQTAVSRASQGKRDTLPLGTFCIVVADVRLKARIDGWIEGVKQWSACGRIAQLVEHSAYIREGTGSNPVSPTLLQVDGFSTSSYHEAH